MRRLPIAVLLLAALLVGTSPTLAASPGIPVGRAALPSGNVVLSGATTLTADILAGNVTIDPGAVVTTNGHSIVATGFIDNYGQIVAGTSPWGSYPSSYGGSGGGAASLNFQRWIQSGAATRAAGGAAVTVGFNDNGSTPPPPTAINASIAAGWYSAGIQAYLAGASGGNVTGYITAGQGSYGVYLSASSVIAGTIDAAGQAGRGHCSGIGLSGGGGGGVVLIVAGAGGIINGSYDVRGGARAYDCGYGTTASGAGGDGQVLLVGTVIVPPTPWRKLTTPTAPPSINGAGFAYDPAIRSLVLFGGNGPSARLNETWLFGPTRSWSQLSPTVAPSARVNPAMAWDPVDQYVLLFGGATTGNAGTNDTWAFANGSWTQLHPSVAPSPRASAEMVYDPALGEVILFGGTSNYCCSNAGLGDTWAFSHGNWTRLAPATSPPQRNDYGMAYYPAIRSVVLFGGWQPGGGCGGPLSDTWAYANGTWSPVNSSFVPSARQGDRLANDTHLGYLVLFGGQAGACGTAHPDAPGTWVLYPSGWSPLVGIYQPGRRAYEQMTYDPALGAIVLFGGVGGTGRSPVLFDDTWLFR